MSRFWITTDPSGESWYWGVSSISIVCAAHLAECDADLIRTADPLKADDDRPCERCSR